MKQLRLLGLVLSFCAVTSLSFAADFIAEAMKVKFHYTLTVDGSQVESSEGQEPLEYIHGEGRIIPGLSKALTGLKVGDKKTVEVGPEEAYGDVVTEAIVPMPKNQFPEEFVPEVGLVIEMRNEDGTILPAVIQEIQEENIILNFNHPLAGKSLTFDVEIVSIEDTTKMEEPISTE